MKNKMTRKRALGIFTWALVGLFILIIGGLAFTYISPKYTIYTVNSESMAPALNLGDLIITGPVPDSEGYELQPGMIIAYEHNDNMVTHRIVASEGNTVTTKGDAAEENDPYAVPLSTIHGIYLFRVPLAGYVLLFLQTNTGWALLVIVPAVLITEYLIRQIWHEVKKKKRQRQAEDIYTVPAELEEHSFVPSQLDIDETPAQLDQNQAGPSAELLNEMMEEITNKYKVAATSKRFEINSPPEQTATYTENSKYGTDEYL